MRISTWPKSALFHPTYLAILTNDGTGQFTLDAQIDTGSSHYVVGGDFDRDGDLDLAVENRLLSRVTIVLNDGSGNFSISSTISVSAPTPSLVAGDLDNDNDLDLAVTSESTNSIFLLSNDGVGNFSFDQTISNINEPWHIKAGDLDGDSDLELVVPNYGANTISILQNNGSGEFTLEDILETGVDPMTVILNDLTCDGTLDIAVTNRLSDNVMIFENSGDATFDLHTTLEAGDGSRALVSADFDLDGDPDLAVANQFANTVMIFENLPSQLPSITILQPDGIDDIADGSFTITWTDDDPDDDASIALYYDTDDSGEDGTLIVDGLSEDDETDEYVWDTSALAEGDYYVYGVIDDAENQPIIDYSDGPVTIYRDSNTLYVDVNNDNIGDGSQANPYNSIQEAVDNSIPGDEIWVAQGTYYENIIINYDHNSVTVLGGFNPVTWDRDIEMYPTVVDGDGGNLCIGIYSASHIRVSGFWLTNANDLILVENSQVNSLPATDILIERNYMHDTVVSYSTYTRGVAVGSLMGVTNENITIRNNVIWNIIGNGTHGNGIEICIHDTFGNNGSANNIHVLNNTVVNTSGDGIILGAWIGDGH